MVGAEDIPALVGTWALVWWRDVHTVEGWVDDPLSIRTILVVTVGQVRGLSAAGDVILAATVCSHDGTYADITPVPLGIVERIERLTADPNHGR